MLYIIDNDILDKIGDDKIDDQDLKKLDLLFGILKEVMSSKYNGILVADDNFQNKYFNLKKTNFVRSNTAATRVLDYIFEYYQEIYNLVNQLSIKTLITWRTQPINQTSSKVNLYETIKIDINTFIETSKKLNFYDAISLTVENPTDYQLYQNLVKYFGPSFDRNLTYYGLNMVNGGGGSIGKTMEGEIYNNRRLTVAITDSDRSFFKQTDYIGSTAKNAINTSERLNHQFSLSVTKVFLLNVNEKENLFSPKEYRQVFKHGSAEEKRTLDFLINIENELKRSDNHKLESFLNAFDYKKGINPELVKKNQILCAIAKEFDLITKDLRGLGNDPVIRFFPIQDKNHWDYYRGNFNFEILDSTSFIHCYRMQIANFVYSLGFGFYPIKIP